MTRATLLLVFTAPLFPAAAQSFEVASIKQKPLPPRTFLFGGAGTTDIKISGNRVTLSHRSLTHLVMLAYNIKDFQVDGVPDWSRLRDQIFDVEAKVEGDAAPTPSQVRPLLQSLLAERFHLQVRRETRELPVYNLVVGKNGPKFKENTGAPPPPPPTVVNASTPIRFTNRSMSDLADFLTSTVDRPVLDQTGLIATYDFTLSFIRSNRDLPSDDDRSIFTAVQEQLGLKLVPAKEPVPIVVIERAERLTEN